MPSHMYYLALVCPPETDRVIRGYKQWLQERYGCRVGLKSPAHITLVPPFWFPAEQEGELIRSLEGFQAELPPLSLNLEGIGRFGKRVLFIAVKENPLLARLRQSLLEWMHQQWPDVVKTDERPFHPHVTLASRDLPPAHVDEAYQHFSQKGFAETVTADRISLLRLAGFHWEVQFRHAWKNQPASR